VRGPQVDDTDVVTGGHQAVNHMRADEAAAAGYQGTHAM
jgi:hypothetical protein